VPTPLSSAEGNYFLPIVAVRPGTAGGTAQVAVLAHFLPLCGVLTCAGIEAGVVVSRDGGSSWSPPKRLTAQPMRTWWLADSGLGPMLGDYFGLVWSAGKPVAVFSLASAPVRSRFRQFIVATRVP
jgi:hypothetical protein